MHILCRCFFKFTNNITDFNIFTLQACVVDGKDDNENTKKKRITYTKVYPIPIVSVEK